MKKLNIICYTAFTVATFFGYNFLDRVLATKPIPRSTNRAVSVGEIPPEKAGILPFSSASRPDVINTEDKLAVSALKNTVNLE